MGISLSTNVVCCQTWHTSIQNSYTVQCNTKCKDSQRPIISSTLIKAVMMTNQLMIELVHIFKMMLHTIKLLKLMKTSKSIKLNQKTLI